MKLFNNIGAKLDWLNRVFAGSTRQFVGFVIRQFISRQRLTEELIRMHRCVRMSNRFSHDGVYNYPSATFHSKPAMSFHIKQKLLVILEGVGGASIPDFVAMGVCPRPRKHDPIS